MNVLDGLVAPPDAAAAAPELVLSEVELLRLLDVLVRILEKGRFGALGREAIDLAVGRRRIDRAVGLHDLARSKPHGTGIIKLALGSRCRRRCALAAIAGAKAAAQHSTTAIAVARATEATPRSEPSYLIGLNFLVISGAVAPLTDIKAPGAANPCLAVASLRASAIGGVLSP